MTCQKQKVLEAAQEAKKSFQNGDGIRKVAFNALLDHAIGAHCAGAYKAALVVVGIDSSVADDLSKMVISLEKDWCRDEGEFYGYGAFHFAIGIHGANGLWTATDSPEYLSEALCLTPLQGEALHNAFLVLEEA